MRASLNVKVLLVAIVFWCSISGSAVAAAQPTRELVLLNWSEYLDPELVKKFETQFNAKVKEVYFESDDLRDDMLLETNAIGYDLAVVNGIVVDSYRKNGWLAPVTEKTVPNLKYVDSRWLEAFPAAKGYAAPYFWGTLGIGYRADLVEKPLTSWLDILQPAEYLRGKIGMVENSRDVFGVALKALGHSVNSTDSQAIKDAEKLLQAQKPYVQTYNYIALNEESALVSGDIIATMVYNGDAMMVQEFQENITYVVPKEGGNLWVDYLVIMENSKNKNLAAEFINFLNEAENAAQLAQFVYYATPNRAAERLLPKDFLEDETIYPSEEVTRRSESYQPIPARVEKKRNNAFARIMR